MISFISIAIIINHILSSRSSLCIHLLNYNLKCFFFSTKINTQKRQLVQLLSGFSLIISFYPHLYKWQLVFCAYSYHLYTVAVQNKETFCYFRPSCDWVTVYKQQCVPTWNNVFYFQYSESFKHQNSHFPGHSCFKFVLS